MENALLNIIHGNLEAGCNERTYFMFQKASLHNQGDALQNMLMRASKYASYYITASSELDNVTDVLKRLTRYHHRTFVVSHKVDTIDELMAKAKRHRNVMRATAVISRFVASWLRNHYRAEFDENARPVLIGRGAQQGATAINGLWLPAEPVVVGVEERSSKRQCQRV